MEVESFSHCMRIKFLTGLLLLLPFLGFSQGEFNKWYFGVNAGIDFNSTPPSALPAGAMNTMHASVSVADSTGSLLFYSQGQSVWNRNHQVMPNGSGLLGGQMNQQVFAVKKPGADNLYFLFSIYSNLFPPGYGLYYSMIDMNLNGGLGDIAAGYKNIQVAGAEQAVSGIHGTRHFNNQDVWIVVRSSNTNQYVSYLITSAGISALPVYSPCSLPACDVGSCGTGVIKISQDGTRYVFQSYDPVQTFSLSEMGRFDPQTGVLTPLFQFRPFYLVPREPVWSEFSPDNKLLYAYASFTVDRRLVFQYDALQTDSALFMQSQILIANTHLGLDLQLGPDGKIYQCVGNEDSLNIIHNPNVRGLGCNFQSNGVALTSGTINHEGLPQFLQRYKAYIHSGGQCQGNPVNFSGDIWPPADTTRWNFGDPASGTANVSTLAAPTHLYATPGTYTVTLYVRHNDNRTDTTRKAITILPSPVPTVTGPATAAIGQTTTYTTQVGMTGYIWSVSSGGAITGGGTSIDNTVSITWNTAGIHHVFVNYTNSSGCSAASPAVIQVTVGSGPPALYEFWFAAPAVTYQRVNWYNMNNPIAFYLMTAEGPANVVIDQPANPSFVPIIKTVNNDSARRVDLTPFIDSVENKPANTILNRGLRITSDKQISVVYEVESTLNAATYTLGGKNALGYEFIIPAQSHFSNHPDCSPPARNSFDIVATEDSTLVRILPMQAIIGHAANDTFSIILNRGQTWSGRATSGDSTKHLGGSFVFADKPVAVTVTDDALFIPGNSESVDITGDQLMPRHLCGTEFIPVSCLDPGQPKLIIYAFENGTHVTLTDTSYVLTADLNRGESTEMVLEYADTLSLSQGYAGYLISNKPILVYQQVEKAILFGDNTWQAAASILPPISCAGSNRVCLPRTPPYGLGGFYLNDIYWTIVTKNGNQGNFQVSGGFPVAVGGFRTVPGTNGAYVFGISSVTSGGGIIPNIIFTNNSGRFQLASGSSTNNIFVPSYNYFKYSYYSDYATLFLGTDRSICPGDSVFLDAGYGKASYLWSTGETTQTIWVKTAGAIWVSTTEPDCQLSDTIVISYYLSSTVNLGPDQTIIQGNSVTFDAGFCAGCTYQWSNLTLGNPNIGTGQTYTTGVAGVYMVSVTSPNGCVGRDTVQLIVIPVSPGNCSAYEYWFAAPAVTNHTVSPSPVSLTDLNSPISMFFTTDEGPATVTVDQPANPLFTPISCTVENDSAEVILLTPFLEMIENKPADSVLNYGLRVTSDKRISASYEIQSPYNAATWSLYGKDALGYTFIIPAQHNYSNYPYCSPPARNSFEVVATEDSTIVTILPAKDVVGHNAHLPFSVLMNRGQTWSGRAISGDATMHLGGTTVTSTKPVAVTVTDDALFLPGYDDLAFDVAGDQLVPENLAGKEFIALAMSIPAVKTLLLCYAKEDNTTVIFNDSISIKTLTVNQGECAQFAFDNVTSGSNFSVASIRSDKPVSVYEFTGNENEFLQPYHSFQASCSIIPPVECSGSRMATISSTPPGAPWHNWLVYAIAKRENGDGFVCDPPNFITSVGTKVPGTNGVWGYSMHGMSNSDYYYRVKITNTKGRFFIPAYSSAVTSTGQFSKYAYFTDFTALNLGVDRQMCPGDCILLDAGVGWDTYLWSTGDTTSTIIASSAGTYWVSTSETGCQLSDTIVISYYPFTPVNLGPDRSICAGDSTLLNAGPGRSWYLWSTGAITQSIWAKTSGNYWIKTSGGHCDVYDTVAVAVIPPPAITTTPLAKTICTGENTNIALAATVTSTVFHWTASLTSGNITGFSADSGLVISQTLINIGTTTGVVIYHITPKKGDCAGLPVDYVVTVNTGNPVGVTISAAANNICAGTPVTFTASPVNAGSNPTYQWKVNGLSAGTNSPTFTYTPNDGDIVIVNCQSSIVNCVSNNPATSNTVTMTVNPNLTLSVTVTPSSNPVCQGEPVTFVGAANNGGPTPLYQWFVNGVNMFTGSPVYTYTPTDGDIVIVHCQSSIVNCISNNPATSAPLTMVVNTGLPAGVTITASDNPFCPGTAVTFTGAAMHGGSTPLWQWLVNGSIVFTGSPVYTFTPQSGDSIRCIMTSNLTCVTGNPATSNTIVMAEKPKPNVTFTACFDTITTVNAKPFKLKGGLPIGGTYSGPGVNSTTGIFTPSLAGPGNHQITYTYQNTYGCEATKQSLIHTFTQSLIQCGSPFTDIRDGKVYLTVQIGSQCWFQKNLEYGITIPDNIPQTDNCIPEKFSYHIPPVTRHLSPVTNHASPVTRHDLYQWDELMQYQTAEGSQGLCPPGWHVPTEADWTILMNYYLGNGRAGRPLQDTVINGFKALRSGVFYLNSSWSFLDFATMFWSSTLSGSDRALAHGMNLYNFSVSLYPASRGNAFGVRCLRDSQ